MNLSCQKRIARPIYDFAHSTYYECSSFPKNSLIPRCFTVDDLQLPLHLLRPTGHTVRVDYYVLCLVLLSFLLHVALSHGSATLLFFTDSDCQDPAPSTLNETGDGRCTAIHDAFGSFEFDQIMISHHVLDVCIMVDEPAGFSDDGCGADERTMVILSERRST